MVDRLTHDLAAGRHGGRWRLTSLAALVATSMLLTACGNRGPLYLPDPAKEAQKRQPR